METAIKEIKCVIWDLDDTLWHGTLAEDRHVRLKMGIEHVIQELDKRGILQSIASKNHADDALHKLKEFHLDEYFLYPEIHWSAKSSSVRNISERLNLGVDACLFIDDQQYERDEVQSVFPEITCMPAGDYMSMLSNPRLNPAFLTVDSRRRRRMYLDALRREKDEREYEGPAEKFLISLKMELLITEAHEEDLQRAQELTLRTHQLNATGIVYSYEELNFFRTSASHKLYICELIDRYGSYGKIGVALVEIREHWHIRLLLVSCRVMSRGIGTILLSFLMREAKKQSRKMHADFKMADRNRQMYILFKFADFKEIWSDEAGHILLESDLSHIQAFPRFMKIVHALSEREQAYGNQ